MLPAFMDSSQDSTASVVRPALPGSGRVRTLRVVQAVFVEDRPKRSIEQRLYFQQAHQRPISLRYLVVHLFRVIPILSMTSASSTDSRTLGPSWST